MATIIIAPDGAGQFASDRYFTLVQAALKVARQDFESCIIEWFISDGEYIRLFENNCNAARKIQKLEQMLDHDLAYPDTTGIGIYLDMIREHIDTARWFAMYHHDDGISVDLLLQQYNKVLSVAEGFTD